MAKRYKNHSLEQAFRNTYYCLSELIISEGKWYGKYCKNRFCTVCLSYRKAGLINCYLPIVRKWKNPYLVVLTVKSVPAWNLNSTVDKVIKEFTKIKNKYVRKASRRTGSQLIGIRTLECNFNPKKRTYNPHLHILVANKQMAEILVEEWPKRWGREHVYKGAQFYRKIEDTERDLIEVIKYNTKIFSKPKNDNSISMKVYIKAMYNIIVAMKGHRIIERFGFNLPEFENDKEKVITNLIKYDKVVYTLKYTDWVNEETGELLSNFNLDPELRDLLKNKIDTSLE